MPESQSAVLGAGNNDWQLGVVAGKGNIVSVAFERGNQRLCGVIPDLDGSVIGRRQQVWLVGVGIVVDVVNTLGLVSLEGKVGVGGAQIPNLDGSVQACRGKSVGILGVNGEAHDVMAVTLEDLDALPAALPVPKLDCHVIGGG